MTGQFRTFAAVSTDFEVALRLLWCVCAFLHGLLWLSYLAGSVDGKCPMGWVDIGMLKKFYIRILQ